MFAMKWFSKKLLQLSNPIYHHQVSYPSTSMTLMNSHSTYIVSTDLSTDQACTDGYNAILLTLVGSRGHYESFAKLATVLHMPARDLMKPPSKCYKNSHHWLFYYLVLQEQIIIAIDMSFVVVVFFYTFFFFFLSFRKLWQFGNFAPYFIFCGTK